MIESDCRKYNTKPGGGWIIADEEGEEILSEYNPDVDNITQINSYRAEIYDALSIFIYLEEYCKLIVSNSNHRFNIIATTKKMPQSSSI